ncbi:hypothetical protein ACHAWC_001749 [Mediolabrus comicus]
METMMLILAVAGCQVDAFQHPLPILPSKNLFHPNNNNENTIHYFASPINDDVPNDVLDSELAAEVDAALLLAQQAIEGSTEEGLDAIADLLLEEPIRRQPTPPKDAPPTAASALSIAPTPPTEPPMETISSKNDADIETQDIIEEKAQTDQLPPTTSPTSFGETLQKAAMEEAEKLKKLLFGLQEDLTETEARVDEARGTADALKREIEASIKERDDTVKNIESEFAAEKERLAKEIGSASEDLKLLMDESVKHITDAQSDASLADEALISKMDSLQSAIEKITSEVIGTEKEKEEIQQTKPSRLKKIVKEAKDNMAGLKKSIEFENEYISRINADLVQMANEAESRVRDVYDAAAKIRNERLSLQEQIETVERSALTQIAELEQKLVEDDSFYAQLLTSEKARISKVIDDAYKKYGEIVGKEEAKRKSVEADYDTQLNQKQKEGKAAIDAVEKKAKEKLDALEAKHSKQRIEIYQQKVEAVSAERDEMLAELAIESNKLETIHTKMGVKLNRVRTDVAGVKAAFEQELRKRRQLAEEERQELLGRIEDVRTDLTMKIVSQQESLEAQKLAYINEQDAAIAISEEECRRAWSDLATLKQSLNYADEDKKRMTDTVAEKAALIESYENDRRSFRKSVKLSFKVAKEKIGTKAKGLLGKDE